MSATRPELAARAPAKVNLWLAVHGRRDDGYHELSTVMLALELADVLRARPTPEPGVRLVVGGPQASPDVPTGADNLVVRAAERVRERARERGAEPPGLALELEKHVPSQAGLGGGSADAAAALTLAERVLGVDAGADWRRATLAELGADCVFFHDVGPSALALCEGVGERVTPLPGAPPRWSLALLVPETRSPTAAVFAALAGRPRVAGAPDFGPGFQELGAAALRGRLATDLEPAALAAVPELGRWRSLLDAHGASHFRLSGSGSSWFGLFDDAAEAGAEVARLRVIAAEHDLGLRLATVTRAAGAGARTP